MTKMKGKGCLRVIILDNEPFMLEKLEGLLNKFECLEVIGKYTRPRDALEAILEDKPDIAFLEIDIAVLSGIEIAEIIKDKYPEIHIVFVTTYHDYAIQAFELNATDYLVKPVQYFRLQITIQRIYGAENSKPLRGTFQEGKGDINKLSTVCCFGSLDFKQSEDRYLPNIKWRTKKTQELFAYLLHNEKKTVRKDALVDMLWPHVEWNQGISLLYSAIYQIRKVLNSINYDISIENSENTYTLFLNNVKVDVKEWENNIQSIGKPTVRNIDRYIKLIKLYKGDYLGDYDYPWSEVEKERLRSLWLYHMELVNEFLTEKNEYIKAIQLNHFVQNVYPTGERSYFNLMKLYDKIDDDKSVNIQYKALTNMLEDEFGIEPNDEMQHWYNHWMNKDANKEYCMKGKDIF